MTQTIGPATTQQRDLPDHTQLPETDGIPVKNFQEHPQSILLTDSLQPVLRAIHPDKQYAIGQDCGIYWRYDADDPLKGAVAPDWFYVPHVPPLLAGEYRRSYVMWKELVPPLIAIELASGDGTEERNATPPSPEEKPGKFWVYERVLHIPYYGIYVMDKSQGHLEMYHWQDLRYQPMTPDADGRFAIPPLGVSLGIWRGLYYDEGSEMDWLRWWDRDGNLLPTGDERATMERDRAERAEAREARAQQEAAQEREKAARLAERLRALGVDPDAV